MRFLSRLGMGVAIVIGTAGADSVLAAGECARTIAATAPPETTVTQAAIPLIASSASESLVCGGGLCKGTGDCRRCRNASLIDFMIGSSSEHCGEGGWFAGEFGYLWNMKPSLGLGGKFFVGGDDCGERMGVRAVGRRWLASELSFEIAPGIALGGTDDQSFPAFSLQVALDVGGYVGLVYSLEQIRPGLPRSGQWAPGFAPETRWESIIGFRASSFAVPLALGLIVVGVAASGGVMGGG